MEIFRLHPDVIEKYENPFFGTEAPFENYLSFYDGVQKTNLNPEEALGAFYKHGSIGA